MHESYSPPLRWNSAALTNGLLLAWFAAHYQMRDLSLSVLDEFKSGRCGGRHELTERRNAIRALGGTGMPATELASVVLATEPGDIIVFDEHLFHSSHGGITRRQWRIDYLRDPSDPVTRNNTVAYFSNIYAPNWSGGYDVDRYPSYGPDWRASGRPAAARLQALGVYELAAKQELFTKISQEASRRQ